MYLSLNSSNSEMNYFLRFLWQGHGDPVSCAYFQHAPCKFRHLAHDRDRKNFFNFYLSSPHSILTGVCEPRIGCKTLIPIPIRFSLDSVYMNVARSSGLFREGRFGLCSELCFSNPLSLLSKRFKRFVQSLFSAPWEKALITGWLIFC